jgi:hypothetical protein
MAYIADFAITYGGAITNIAMNMPQHQTGDLLIALVTMNSGSASAGATSSPASGNWVVASNATNADNTFTWLRALATGSTNALYLTTADDYCCTVIAVRDVGGTTATDAIDVSNITGSTTSTAVPSNASVTPTLDDSLVVYLMAVNGIATAQHSPPGIHNLISFDNGGSTAGTAITQGVGWYIHRTGGTATPAPQWVASAAGNSARATIAIKNKTGGRIPAYIGDATAPAEHILGGHFTSTVTGTLVSYTGSLTMTGSMTNGKTTSYVAVSTSVGADLGINPFSFAATKAAATQAATALTGFEVTLTNAAGTATSRDFSGGGLIVGSVIGGTPKMGSFGIGSIAQGGCVVRVGSGASAWKAYQVAAKDANPTTEARSVFSIQPGYTGTQYGSAGSWTTSSTQYLQFLSNQPSFASSVNWAEIYYAGVHVVCGGDSTYPVDTSGVAEIGKSYRLPVIQKFGGAGLLSYVPIQIGGEDSVNFQIEAGALQFPERYNTSSRNIAYHGADNALGISYAGKSGDVIKHINSVITSLTPYYWEINAAATNAATWDFSGLVVVGAGNITLRNVMTFNDMSFNTYGTATTSGCTLVNCSFTEPAATSGSLVVDSSTSFSDCVFDTTTITAGNYLTTTTTPSVFTNCTFNGSSSSGHAIEITTPGTYTFSGNILNGYGATGSTSAAIYNNSGGTVVLNVSGGGTVPTYRNGAGATTTVNASADVTLTGLVAGTEVRAYVGTDPATSVEIAGTESSGTTFSFAQSSGGQAGYIQIFNVSYQPVWIDITYSSSDVTIPIQQITDRNYQP